MGKVLQFKKVVEFPDEPEPDVLDPVVDPADIGRVLREAFTDKEIALIRKELEAELDDEG